MCRVLLLSRVPMRRFLLSAAILPLFAGPLAAFPSLSPEGWTVTVGATIGAQPAWMGSSRMAVYGMPRFSLSRPGSAASARFSSFDDGISPALIDTGLVRMGLNIGFAGQRRSSSDSRLAGLRDVPFTVEAGLFAEMYPFEWLRLRAALRHGIGGHGGLVGDLGADAIWRPDNRWTLAVGPRAHFGSDAYVSRYFSVSAAESAASGLPVYRARGGFTGVGAAASVSYRFDGGWTVTGFAAYERLVSSAADAPLVRLRGSADQFTVGTSVTYSFTLGR